MKAYVMERLRDERDPWQKVVIAICMNDRRAHGYHTKGRVRHCFGR